MDQITEADVIAGGKIISIQQRNGNLISIGVRGLSWRTVTELASEIDLGKRNIRTIESGVYNDVDRKLLDEVTPDAIGDILAAISLLTNGIPGLKKNQERLREAVARQIMPTTGTPSASSSNADTPPEIYKHSLQPSYSRPSADASEGKPGATCGDLPLPVAAAKG